MKTVVKTNATNTAVKPQQNGKVATTTKPVKVEITKEPADKAEQQPLSSISIEDTIRKVSQLSNLCEQRQALLTAREKIDGFTFGSDGRQDSLTLKDCNGKEFFTSNSHVIDLVANLLGSEIDKRLEKVEIQISL